MAHRGLRRRSFESLEPGEAVAVLGPNGAGKSTLLVVAGRPAAPGRRPGRAGRYRAVRPRTGGAGGCRRTRRGVALLAQDAAAVPASDRARQRRLRARGGRSVALRGPRGRAERWLAEVDASRVAGRDARHSCPAARRNGWRSPGPWPRNRDCCCWTSRWPPSMSRWHRCCAACCGGCCADRAAPAGHPRPARRAAAVGPDDRPGRGDGSSSRGPRTRCCGIRGPGSPRGSLG